MALCRGLVECVRARVLVVLARGTSQRARQQKHTHTHSQQGRAGTQTHTSLASIYNNSRPLLCAGGFFGAGGGRAWGASSEVALSPRAPLAYNKRALPITNQRARRHLGAVPETRKPRHHENKAGGPSAAAASLFHTAAETHSSVIKMGLFPHTRLFTLNEQQRQRHPLAAAPSLLTSPTPSNSSVRVAFYPPRAHKGACGWRSWARTTHPGVCCVPASTAPLGGVCAWARAGVFFVGARARAVHRSHSWGRVRAPPVCFCCSSRVLERERSD